MRCGQYCPPSGPAPQDRAPKAARRQFGHHGPRQLYRYVDDIDGLPYGHRTAPCAMRRSPVRPPIQYFTGSDHHAASDMATGVDVSA
ncbi:hypothetical protein GCM10027360_93930 [Amycolatopsis echigonensis]|nr:hypothetical protein GCM10017788_51050 [Amycolatopsis acidiphila]